MADTEQLLMVVQSHQLRAIRLRTLGDEGVSAKNLWILTHHATECLSWSSLGDLYEHVHYGKVMATNLKAAALGDVLHWNKAMIELYENRAWHPMPTRPFKD